MLDEYVYNESHNQRTTWKTCKLFSTTKNVPYLLPSHTKNPDVLLHRHVLERHYITRQYVEETLSRWPCNQSVVYLNAMQRRTTRCQILTTHRRKTAKTIMACTVAARSPFAPRQTSYRFEFVVSDGLYDETSTRLNPEKWRECSRWASWRDMPKLLWNASSRATCSTRV